MQLSLSWLKSLFPYDFSNTVLEQTLTAAGIEVDAMEAYAPPFTHVVSAKVEEVVKHPNADKLQIAKVFDGHNHYTVVCGAPNCRAGLTVAFAKPGAWLGKENPLEIKERAVRGVHSQGMLCSLDELGLSSQEEPGIVELEDSFPLGVDLHKMLCDDIFTLSVTPNLGHTLSVLGVARELAAFLKKPVVMPKAPHSLSAPTQQLECSLDTPDCKAYFVHKISGMKSTKTPFLIQHRLRLAGYNPKNLAVDILNYVMIERGLPMHAFDCALLPSQHLKIQNTQTPETFTALNGKTYNLPKGTLVITAQNQVIAVAGVIGSESTASQSHTHSILIEAAYFTPQAVRRSIKALDLRTEAANRFEKGIDPAAIATAIDYATALILEFSNGHYEARYQQAESFKIRKIELSIDKTNRLLGTSLTQNEIASLLEHLDMKPHGGKTGYLEVEIPSYRNDLSIAEDLIEEVGRLYGLEHLTGTLVYHATAIQDHPLYSFEKPLKKAFFSLGLQEILTCDLLSPLLADDFRLDHTDKKHTPIQVLHPRSIDQSALRMSLLASFIPVIRKNLAVKEKNLQCFEVGKTHAQSSPGEYLETLQGAFVLTGDQTPYHFDDKPRKVDFFDLKGMAETLLTHLGIQDIRFEMSHDKAFHPYQQLSIVKEGSLIGKIGQVHPDLLKKYAIDQKVFFAEFSVPELMIHRKTIYPVLLPPTQPFTERDWTVSLKESQSFSELENLCKQHLPKSCESLVLLDIYPQEEGKNITLRFRYRDQDKSLESEQVDTMHQNFIQTVAKKLA